MPKLFAKLPDYSGKNASKSLYTYWYATL